MRMAATRKFPVLSTKQLSLRAATAKDAPAFQQVLAIAEVTRFSNWPDAPAKTQVERALRRRGLRPPDLPAQPHRRLDPARQRRLGPRAGKSGISPRRHAAAEGVVQGRVSRFSNVRTDRGRCYKSEIRNA